MLQKTASLKSIENLPWEPHPYIEHTLQTFWRGVSIITGEFLREPAKYETLDRIGLFYDCLRFNGDVELLSYLNEEGGDDAKE